VIRFISCLFGSNVFFFNPSNYYSSMNIGAIILSSGNALSLVYTKILKIRYNNSGYFCVLMAHKLYIVKDKHETRNFSNRNEPAGRKDILPFMNFRVTSINLLRGTRNTKLFKQQTFQTTNFSNIKNELSSHSTKYFRINSTN